MLTELLREAVFASTLVVQIDANFFQIPWKKIGNSNWKLKGDFHREFLRKEIRCSCILLSISRARIGLFRGFLQLGRG